MTQDQSAASSFIIIQDEFGYYDTTGDDGLKDTLRNLKGIENAKYVVFGDMIFVFDKLLALVKKHLNEHPGADPREFAAGMVSAATIPIAEAVTKWQIVPSDFRVEPQGKGFHIWHTELMARLPQDFKTMDEVNDALVALLRGQIISGDGTFAYKGQNLIFTHSMDPNLLPQKPESLRKCPKPQRATSRLADTMFYPGFSPIDEARFRRIQSIERDWVLNRERMRSDALQNAGKIWAILEDFSWDACIGVGDDIPDYGTDDLIELRKLYPRLTRLSDQSLYHHFDDFEFHCRSSRHWQPNFDEGFLFYLLGEASGWYSGGHIQEEFGEFAGHAILSGLQTADALNWAEGVETYNTAVRKLAWRTDSAMRFLKAEKTRKPGVGPEIFTFTDLYERSRSIGAAPVFLVQ